MALSCRGCRKTGEKFLNIFDDDCAAKFIYITSLEVSEHDSLPHHICQDCDFTNKLFYEFKYKSIQSYQFLKENCSDDATIVIDDSDEIKDSQSLYNQNSKICRSCLSTTAQLIDLRSDQAIVKLYENSTSFKIDKNSSIPLSVCVACFFDACSYYEFKVMCTNSDEFFRNTYQIKKEVKIKQYVNKKRVSKDISKQRIVSVKNVSDDRPIGIFIESYEHPVDTNRTHVGDDNKIEDEDANDEGRFIIDDSISIEINQIETKPDVNTEKIHIRKKNIKYECDVCCKIFTRKISLLAHCLKHSEYICLVCRTDFYDKSRFERHTALMEGKQYDCELCNKSFHYIKLRNKHQETHRNFVATETEEKKYKHKKYRCTTCNKTFLYEKTSQKCCKDEMENKLDQQILEISRQPEEQTWTDGKINIIDTRSTPSMLLVTPSQRFKEIWERSRNSKLSTKNMYD